MRAVSLVRYWLYGLRGFVVMTASLAIAFSIAVTGPPTDEEIDRVSAVVTRVAAAAGEDLEALAIKLCPELPAEARVVCAPTLTVEEEPRPVVTPEEKPPLPAVEVATVEEAPQPAAERQQSQELLGAPSRQRARPQRAEPERRVNTERRAVRRVQPQRRTAQAQRPRRVPAAATAPAPAPREPERQVEPAPVARDGAAARVIDEPRDDERALQDDNEREYQDWRERRRERRQRRYEREYGAPEDYEQEEPAYRDEYYEEESWPADAH